MINLLNRDFTLFPVLTVFRPARLVERGVFEIFSYPPLPRWFRALGLIS
jgi:hypothetical protein